MPRSRSQRIHANRKRVAQVSLASSLRQWLQSTVCVDRKPAPVNMHTTIAEACFQGHGPIWRWNRMLTSIGRRQHECHTVCEKRLQSQSGPWVESPRGRRGHSLPRSSNLPSHCTSEPWTRQRSAARTTTLAALDSRVAHRDVRGKSVCSSFDFVQIGCLSGRVESRGGGGIRKLPVV